MWRNKRVVLEHETDVAITHVVPGYVFTVEHDVALIRRFQAGNDPQQRGLAAARGTEQRDELAALDVQADVIQRLERIEILADVTHFDRHEIISSAALARRRLIRFSLHCFSSRMKSAMISNRLATANAATWLYSL